jgi:hypothetical protein
MITVAAALSRTIAIEIAVTSNLDCERIISAQETESGCASLDTCRDLRRAALSHIAMGCQR